MAASYLLNNDLLLVDLSVRLYPHQVNSRRNPVGADINRVPTGGIDHMHQFSSRYIQDRDFLYRLLIRFHSKVGMGRIWEQ